MVGEPFKALMVNYRRPMAILVSTHDEADQQNGVLLDSTVQDEHGRIPLVHYRPTRRVRKGASAWP